MNDFDISEISNSFNEESLKRIQNDPQFKIIAKTCQNAKANLRKKLYQVFIDNIRRTKQGL